jgi:hypothetical protein
MLSFKPSFKNFIVLIIVIYITYHALNIGREMFHNTGVEFNNSMSNMWWHPAKTQYPYGLDPSEDAMGDLTLTNLYRKLHNIENISRIGVLEHSHLKQPGGDDGTNRQFYIAEAMDRDVQKIQQQIRDEIALRRNASIVIDGIPHTSLGGNFYDCHIGDCQWDLDNNEQILGIPSTVGTIHPYY